MLLVQPVRPGRRAQVPAVTHVDGTARLQSATATEHPLYHRLISGFAAHTGVPVILNTSFNLRGEPIVHRPAEAVGDFLNSEIDRAGVGPTQDVRLVRAGAAR
jgi:carbamoyltransferase